MLVGRDEFAVGTGPRPCVIRGFGGVRFMPLQSASQFSHCLYEYNWRVYATSQVWPPFGIPVSEPVDNGREVRQRLLLIRDNHRLRLSREQI